MKYKIGDKFETKSEHFMWYDTFEIERADKHLYELKSLSNGSIWHFDESTLKCEFNKMK